MSFFSAAGAFLRKDFLEDSSYRLTFLFGLIGMVFFLVFLSFVSGFVGDAISEKLSRYQGSYFAFLVLGIGLFSLLDTALRELSARIRLAQTLGTFEALLATGVTLRSLLICLPLYPLLRTSFRILGYLLLGAWVFDLPLQLGGAPAALLVLVLTLLNFGCIGLAFAALTLVFKRTERFIAAFSSLSALFGGVFYPVEELPEWLQAVAAFFPITPALRGVREALLGVEGGGITGPVVSLALFLVVLFPVSVLVFRRAIRRAMRDGTLSQY